MGCRERARKRGQPEMESHVRSPALFLTLMLNPALSLTALPVPVPVSISHPDAQSSPLPARPPCSSIPPSNSMMLFLTSSGTGFERPAV